AKVVRPSAMVKAARRWWPVSACAASCCARSASPVCSRAGVIRSGPRRTAAAVTASPTARAVTRAVTSRRTRMSVVLRGGDDGQQRDDAGGAHTPATPGLLGDPPAGLQRAKVVVGGAGGGGQLLVD